MTLLEAAVLFSRADKIIGERCCIQIHENIFRVMLKRGNDWYTHRDYNYSYSLKEVAFGVFIQFEFGEDGDFFQRARRFTMVIEKPSIRLLTEIDKAALSILNGDPVLVDALQDVLLRG